MRAVGIAGLVALALLGCSRSAGRDPRAAEPSDARANLILGAIEPPSTPRAGPTARPVGVTHEELLRRADAAVSVELSAQVPAGTEPPTRVEGRTIAEDRAFADETPVEAMRARFELSFPDERAERPAVERVLRVDDQGERLVALLYGTGLVLAPGLRVGGRASMAGWALVGADGTFHRAMSPDALRGWFLGVELDAGSALSFVRTERAVTATRGALSVTLSLDASGPVRPLSCRWFVSLLLGGDPAGVREGCDGARAPSRVVLRARGRPALSWVRASVDRVSLPRDALAVPPRASVDRELAWPSRAREGGFFSPSELTSIGPLATPGRPRVARPDASALEVRNPTAHELVLFVDDVAIGWLGPGRTVTFAGISAGRHAARARTADGLHAGPTATTSAPGRWEITLDPPRGR